MASWNSKTAALAIGVLAAFLTGGVARADVLLDPAYYPYASYAETNLTTATGGLNFFSLPMTGVEQSITDGAGATNDATYNQTATGFDTTFNQTTTVEDAEANTSITSQILGNTNFVAADSTTYYDFSGSVTFTGTSPDNAVIGVTLTDVSTSATLLIDQVAISSTGTATLAGGSITGSLTGPLNFGDSYDVVYNEALTTGSGASASGNLNLDFVDTAVAVPSPAPVWAALALVGGILLITLRRRAVRSQTAWR